MKSKTRVVIYHYGPDSAAEAKDRAQELRAEGVVARTIDATNFADIEETDKTEFVGDFPGNVKEAIRDAYEKIDRRVFTRELSEHSDGDEAAIDIPQRWAELSFPELQKLAAALSDSAVRTQADAVRIIEDELERREERLKSELKDNDPAGGRGVPSGKKTETSSADVETDGDDGEDDESNDGDSDDDELDGMTKAELIDYAEEKGIDLGDASKKADILAAIRNHKE